MRQSNFIVYFLVASISNQLLVLGKPAIQSLPAGFQGENIGKTLQVGPLAFTELGRFASKTYWIGSNSVAQAAARTECTAGGFDLLKFTAGTDEYNFIQTRLAALAVTTNVWTDYANYEYNDGFRSRGDVLPHSLAITPSTAASTIIGLSILRTGPGLVPTISTSGLRYICV